MSQSKKRVIRDPRTPAVTDGGSLYVPAITLHLGSVGGGKLEVSVTLRHWQVQQMIRDIRAVTATQAKRLRDLAHLIETQVNGG